MAPAEGVSLHLGHSPLSKANPVVTAFVPKFPTKYLIGKSSRVAPFAPLGCGAAARYPLPFLPQGAYSVRSGLGPPLPAGWANGSLSMSPSWSSPTRSTGEEGRHTFSNKTDLAAPLGVLDPTIGQWLSILKVTGQIILLPPYFDNF